MKSLQAYVTLRNKAAQTPSFPSQLRVSSGDFNAGRHAVKFVPAIQLLGSRRHRPGTSTVRSRMAAVLDRLPNNHGLSHSYAEAMLINCPT